MCTRQTRKLFILSICVTITLVVALAAPSVANAGFDSPFLGKWEATDIDGSDIRLAIGGPPRGPFQITWTESYLSFCNGEPGILRGTGQLNEGDPNLLEADLYLECFTTGASMELSLAWRYHPLTDKLSGRYDNGFVNIWSRPGRSLPPPPALGLRVNYGHDWVESFYEGGHMAWITVTESDGVTVKAMAGLVTEPKDFWGGETGFQTRPEDWIPAPPDIQPNDWVFGWVDNGASGQVQIGEITGVIDLGTDTIEGTVLAPWFSGELPIDCHSWGALLPEEIMKYDAVLPDGEDLYSCSWAGEWNIQPYQDVGVGYSGPDGHWVVNAFFARDARIVASETGNWLWTSDFNPGTLNISIYESASESAPLLWAGQQEADESGFLLIGDNVHGQDLVPGSYLTVSDGFHEKGLVLEPVAITVFDTDNEIMAGTAPGGREVTVVAGMAEAETQARLTVTASPEDGTWMVDFKSLQEPFDITEDMRPWSFAQIFDEDGDANEGNPPPSLTWVGVYKLDLPAETWTLGVHNYYFGDNIGNQGALVSFTVSEEAPIYNRYALLRGTRLWARNGDACVEISAIHPAQETRFHSGWTTPEPMTYEEAVAYMNTLTPWIVADGGEALPFELYEIVPFVPETWQDYFCTFTE